MGYSERAGTAGALQVVPVAQLLTGTSAQPMVISAPPGAQGGYLSSVSCTSVSFCVAVGYFVSSGPERALAEVMKNGTWERAAVPAASTGNNVLASVSCTGVASPACTAVGHYRDPSGVHVLIADFTASSSGFVLAHGTDQKGPDNSLSSVSCVAGSFCMAVGSYNNGHAEQTLVEMGSNGVWTLVASPDRSVANNVLTSVSCPFAAFCQAVGYYSDGVTQRTLAELFQGSIWKLATAPNVGANGAVVSANELAAVACVSASQCEAVGQYQLQGRPKLLAEVFGRNGWSVEPTSAYQAPEDVLQGTSCPASRQCVAVGYQVNGAGVEQPLIEEQSSMGWSAVTMALPSSALALAPASPSGQLYGVSCWSAGDCVAVGSFVGGSGNDQPLLATELKGVWSASVGPGPGLAAAAVLWSVSCPAGGACVAVGEYRNTGGATLPMVDAQQHGNWALSYVPGQGSVINELRSVSCVEPAACVAVGEYSSKPGTAHTLVEQLRDGFWSIVPSPDAPSATSSVLAGVSCPVGGTCVAVGYWSAGPAIGALVEDGTSAGWQVAAAPGTANASLQAVSCLSGLTCAAAGYYLDKGVPSALVVVTSAGGWLPAPAAAPGQSSHLVAVSCAASDRSCAAAGAYDDGEAQAPLVETGVTAPAPPQHTRTAVTSPAASVFTGQSVSFTATVTPGPGGGDVEFLDDGASVPSCKAVAVGQGGEAVCQVVFSSVGHQLVQAVFSGSTGFDPSSSVIFDLLVKARPSGYWLTTRDGHVFATGAARALGSAPAGTEDVVSMAPTPDGSGYWLVTAHGAVFAFGTARSFGGLPALGVKAADIVALAPAPDGGGYWLVGRDGGSFAFGDAKFAGSLPARHVHVHDIVGVQSSGSAGYLLVGADGGVFRFGTASFFGSLPARHVHTDDIRAMVVAPGGRGYTLVGADGGAFTFGRGAPYCGSLPGRHVKASDIVGVALSSDDKGYLMAGADGHVYAFGDAKAQTVPVSLASHLPVVAVAGA